MDSKPSSSQSKFLFYFIPAIPFILITTLSIIAFFFVDNVLKQQDQSHFQMKVSEVEHEIENKLEQHENLLNALRGLFVASQEVSREEFKYFVQSLGLKGYSKDLQAVAFSLFIKASDKASIIDKVRQEGFKEFDIHPSGERDLYTAIYFIEPFEGVNLNAFGYDMYTEINRREAMESSWKENRAVLSRKIFLIQDRDIVNPPSATIMYLPVYERNMPIDTVQERDVAKKGLVYVPFRIKDLIDGVLGEGFDELSFEIYQGEEINEENLLYRHKDRLDYDGATLKNILQMKLFGQIWTVRSWEEVSVYNKYLPYFVLIFGVFIGLLFSWILFTWQRTKSQAERIAEGMTKDLAHSHAQLKAVNDAAPFGIFQTDAKGQWIYVNAYFEKMISKNGEQLKGVSWQEFVYSEDYQKTINLWNHSIDAKVNCDHRFRLMVHMDKVIWVHLRMEPLFVGGEHKGFVGIVDDITEEYNQEVAIKQSEEKLKAIIDHSLDGIILINRFGHIMTYNKQIKALLGCTEQELSEFEIFDFAGDDLSLNTLRSMLDKQHLLKDVQVVQRHELKLKAFDSKLIDVEIAIAMIMIEGETWMSCFIKDVTLQKKIMNEERQRIATFERMNKLMVDRELRMVALKKKIKELGGQDDITA